MTPPRRWLDDPTRAPDGALDLLREAPPGSAYDLICCRNLLIYLNVEAQRRLLAQLGATHLRAEGFGDLFGGSHRFLEQHRQPLQGREVQALVEHAGVGRGVAEPRRPRVLLAKVARHGRALDQQAARACIQPERAGAAAAVAGNEKTFCEKTSGGRGLPFSV